MKQVIEEYGICVILVFWGESILRLFDLMFHLL